MLVVRPRHAKRAEPLHEDPAARGALADEPPGDEPILCASCGAAITTHAHRIAVSVSHEHRFVNPAGFTFHIACFDAAIGCTVVGPDSLEYPWFPGYSWRYATCGTCGCHLGWHFRAPDHGGFFGLILDRLQLRAGDT